MKKLISTLCALSLMLTAVNPLASFAEIKENTSFTMKLKSSMTLFSLTSEDHTIFDEVLECFFDGEMDELTLKMINES